MALSDNKNKIIKKTDRPTDSFTQLQWSYKYILENDKHSPVSKKASNHPSSFMKHLDDNNRNIRHKVLKQVSP